MREGLWFSLYTASVLYGCWSVCLRGRKMIHLRRKKKIPVAPNEDRMRGIIREELALHDMSLKDISDKETQRAMRLQRLMSLPKRKQNQLLRYIEKRGNFEKQVSSAKQKR